MKVNLSCAALSVLTVLSWTEKIDDALVRSSMFKASQQVLRAIRRTNHRWRTELLINTRYTAKNIWQDPYQLLQFFKQPPNAESMEMTRAGDVFDVTINMVTDRIHQQSTSHHRSKRRINATDLLSSDVVRDLMSFSGCRVNLGPVTCPTTCLARMYRTHSGVCNNEMHPYWGATNLPLDRWRPPQYENDFNTPRGWEEGRMYNNFELPLVRKVSNDIMSTMNEDVTNDPDYSHLLVVWGQYVDHDMDFTPQSLSTSTFQGLTDCRQSCNNEFPCFPMMVPEDDPRISTRRCIPFFRSAAVCGSGHTSSLVNRITPREQINSINAFVDASAVYGNSDSQNRDLRNLTAKEEGLMRVNVRFNDGGREYLPFSKQNPCVQDRFDSSGEQIPCFDAGDKRVSEHQTLAIIHTLWMREHNRIARRLKVINPHWSGETIYQEARKIIGAYHQIVNWKEYLPKILGTDGVALMGNYTGFQDDVNPSISNVFATAAFRFGHVTIHPEFRRLDENFENHPRYPTILLHEAFFSTWRVIREGGADPIIRGLIGRPAKFARTDQLMHEELREKLFALQNRVALDLASLNLQRGRDHALPGYNDWRVECGMPAADNFSMLAGEIRDEEVRNKLERLYGHPSNVDIWLGGLVEDVIEGARVGPTFQCLIARQFKALRDGDRFFYKNNGQFTAGQLEALERLTFARVICESSGVQRVQRDVFALGEFPRDFMPCSDIPALDLEQWRENPEMGNCGVPPSIENGKWQKCGGDVSYYCDSGFTLDGAAEVSCESSSGRFTVVPSCVDTDECSTNNGDCEKSCRNFPGGFRCECPDDEVLDDDGKKCKKSDQPQTAASSSPVQERLNVDAIIIGSFFAVTLIGTIAAIVVVSNKYFKLRKLNENPMTKLTFNDNRKPIFDNPAMTST